MTHTALRGTPGYTALRRIAAHATLSFIAARTTLRGTPAYTALRGAVVRSGSCGTQKYNVLCLSGPFKKLRN